MVGSFISALSGLRTNQNWLDVIGNNLANSNTPGFKSSRALFSDILSVTFKPGTAPTSSIGGTNPLQVGLGTRLSSVDRSLTQGSIDTTGRTFDLALLGRGHFAMTDGTQTYYTRVGSFGLDAEGNMVDLRSGNRALDAAGQAFTIDTSAVVPPNATSSVRFAGNLPAENNGPLAEVITTSTSLQEGTPAAISGTSAGPFSIPSGETWTMELIINGGAPEEVLVQGSGGLITADDVAQAINDSVDHATATVSANQVVITSERNGTTSTVQVNAGETGKDLKSLLGLSDFVQGTEGLASTSTDLNALASNRGSYQSGDAIEVVGTNADGSPVVASFQYGVDGTSLGDFVNFLGAEFSDATVSFDDATGEISVAANGTGDAELSLAISDAAGQSGATDWGRHFFGVTTNGTGPDTVTSSVEVFDTNGTAHVLTLNYERQIDGSWNLQASVPESEGSVVSGAVTGIQFNDDGSLQTPTGGDMIVQFGGLGEQSISLDLGSSGGFGGLTQFGDPSSVVVDFQDGYGAGELATLQVDGTGIVQGFYSNGQSQELGSFGIATFANENALEEVGDNFLRDSVNTGQRFLGNAQANGSGEIIGGALEGSNVDTAEQFVHMIRAQRGYQANARVVTVQDELLAEIVNIV